MKAALITILKIELVIVFIILFGPVALMVVPMMFALVMFLFGGMEPSTIEMLTKISNFGFEHGIWNL